MSNSLILLTVCSILARFSCAVCPDGTCTSSLESSAQSSALLQHSAVRAVPNVRREYRSHMNTLPNQRRQQKLKKQPAIKDQVELPAIKDNAEFPVIKNQAQFPVIKNLADFPVIKNQAEFDEHSAVVTSEAAESKDLLEAGDPHIPDALIDRKHNLIMGWSARAACTATVNMFFANAGIYHAEEQQKYPWVHDYREARGHAIQPKASEMKNPNFVKFKIVRNPYRRAVSNWVHQMETNFSYNEVYQDLAAKNGVSQESSFVDWLRFVKRVGYDKLDDHSKPQFSDWEKAGGKYDFILQLESNDFDRKLAQINQKAKSALKFQTMHVSSLLATATVRSNSTATDPSKWPFDEVGRLLHPPTEELYKDAEAVRLAQQVYAKDFEAYGYSKADVPVA